MVQMVGGGGYVVKLSSTHQDLATDDSPRVRHTVASGYHEVVRLIGDKSMSAVGIYQKLLNSKSVEVRQSFSSLLSLLASYVYTVELSSKDMYVPLYRSVSFMQFKDTLLIQTFLCLIGVRISEVGSTVYSGSAGSGWSHDRDTQGLREIRKSLPRNKGKFRTS